MTKTDLNMKRIYQIITIAAAAWALAACTDTASIESELAGLEDRTAELEKEAAKINSNAISIRKLLDETLKVVSWEEREDGTGYDLGISDGTTVSIYVSEDGGGIVPVIGIDAEGNWTVSLDGKDFSVIEGSVNAFITESAIPEVRVGKDGYWEISINGGKDFIQITDSDGRPVPAQMTGATDSFFTDVSYDQAARKLDIILADGRELDIPVRVDTYMMPAVREREKPYNLQARLNPEDAAVARIHALKREMGPELFPQYVEQSVMKADHPELAREEPGHMSCMAGQCSFTINWQGEMRPCVILSQPAVSVFEVGFEAAWKYIVEETDKILLNSKCSVCRVRHLCRTCAASALLETGSYEGVPDYMCRYAEESLRLLREEWEKINHGQEV